MAIWTEAGRFELCVLQVDERFTVFSIDEGEEFQRRYISIREVKGVHVGERAVNLCLQHSIQDEHLAPETVLVVLHGEFIGGPSRRNLCVFLVDTEEKQLKLKACFESIYRRAIAGQTCSNQGQSAPPPRTSESGGRTSFGPGVGGPGGAPLISAPDGRTSFGRGVSGPAGNPRELGNQEAPAPHSETSELGGRTSFGPGVGGRTSFGPGVGGPGSNSLGVGSQRPVKWVPPPGYEDSDDEDAKAPGKGPHSTGAFGRVPDPPLRIYGNEPFPPAKDALEPAPGPGRSSQNLNSVNDLSAAPSQRTSKVKFRKMDADEDSDDGLERNPYAQKAKQDPSCSDRMCENSCVVM